MNITLTGCRKYFVALSELIYGVDITQRVCFVQRSQGTEASYLSQASRCWFCRCTRIVFVRSSETSVNHFVEVHINGT